MTEPSVDEIAAQFESYGDMCAMPTAEVRLLIADWRKRGEALEPFARQKIEDMLSMDELELDKDDFLRARAALHAPTPTSAAS